VQCKEEEDPEPSEEDATDATTGAPPGRRPVRRHQRRSPSCTAPTRRPRLSAAPSALFFSLAGEPHRRPPFS
jgi:hypothetical protein